MILLERAEKLKERVERILKKQLTLKDVQITLAYHCNHMDSDEMMLEQLQNRKFRGLVE